MACLNGNMAGGLEMMPPAMTTTFDAPPSAQTPYMGGQLPRSKSLNDISYDSQISAFASDRFINNLPNLNNNNNNNLQAVIADRPTCLDDTRSYKTEGLDGQVSAPMSNGLHILNSNMYSKDLATATNCVDSIYSQRQLSHPNNQQHNLVSIDDLQSHHQINMAQQQQQSLYHLNDSQLNFSRLNPQQQQEDLNRNLNINQCSNSIRGNLFAQTTQAGPATNEFNICNPLAMNMSGLTEQIGNLQL